ncbi:MAG: hypothetical protein ACLFQB_07835 [Chitinispirillaceae bacterium]
MKGRTESALVVVRKNAIFATRWLVKRCNRQSVKKHPFASVMITGFTVLLLISLTVTPEGRIIPLGKEMIAAFELLKSTPTGRELIEEVEKSTRGSIVYMMLGNTEEHDLQDYHRSTVRGVTRSYFKLFSSTYTPSGILIHTNQDLTDSHPSEIVKNIAFELENVIHSMANPGIEFGKDSPKAPVTQNMVCMELGL